MQTVSWRPREIASTASQDASGRGQLKGSGVKHGLDTLLTRFCPEIPLLSVVRRIGDQSSTHRPARHQHLGKERVLETTNAQIGTEWIADWPQLPHHWNLRRRRSRS